ncbi:MAG: VWA domain-containing protein [Candidatus Sulfopaludibacter sp.]|nr:VWA domain-containing protein [Candidatus Sulfopaludibacter sp.]
MILCMLCIPLVLIPMAGLAIDATILRIVQARLSAAVDGAALGVGRLLGTSASPDATAKEFVKANFQVGAAGFWGAGNLNISTVYTPGITKTILVNASADVPLLFMQIFGQRKATVSAAATATRTDSRIMLVIDRSTSMTQVQSDGNTAIADAIAQAIAFVDSWNSGTDEVGLIVFDGTAVVAYPVYAKGTYTTTPSSSGGPDSAFNTIVSPATVGP